MMTTMADLGGMRPHLPESGGQLAGNVVGLAAAADAAAAAVTELSR